MERWMDLRGEWVDHGGRSLLKSFLEIGGITCRNTQDLFFFSMADTHKFSPLLPVVGWRNWILGLKALLYQFFAVRWLQIMIDCNSALQISVASVLDKVILLLNSLRWKSKRCNYTRSFIHPSIGGSTSTRCKSWISLAGFSSFFVSS